MEKAEVIFKGAEEQQITINFLYNKETSDLDYDVKLSEGYSMSSQMDFIGFLAHTLLTSLQLNSDDGGR